MFLALDTSGAVSVALLDPATGEVAASRHAYEPRHHAELLSPFVEQVLTEAGRTPADVTLLVAGQGPGPFTGLRVGLVTARVMALALGVPVHGVMSLDALARAAAPLVRGEFTVATDARRKEVYHAHYRVAAGVAVRIDGPAVNKAVALDAAGVPAVGRGVQLYPDAFTAVPGAEGLLDPAAADLAGVALAELGPRPDPAAVRDPQPLYLRAPDAAVPAASKPVST